MMRGSAVHKGHNSSMHIFMPLASKDAGHIVIVLSVLRLSVFPSVRPYEVNQILPLRLASTQLARMF